MDCLGILILLRVSHTNVLIIEVGRSVIKKAVKNIDELLIYKMYCVL